MSWFFWIIYFIEEFYMINLMILSFPHQSAKIDLIWDKIEPLKFK